MVKTRNAEFANKVAILDSQIGGLINAMWIARSMSAYQEIDLLHDSLRRVYAQRRKLFRQPKVNQPKAASTDHELLTRMVTLARQAGIKEIEL